MRATACLISLLACCTAVMGNVLRYSAADIFPLSVGSETEAILQAGIWFTNCWDYERECPAQEPTASVDYSFWTRSTPVISTRARSDSSTPPASETAGVDEITFPNVTCADSLPVNVVGGGMILGGLAILRLRRTKQLNAQYQRGYYPPIAATTSAGISKLA